MSWPGREFAPSEVVLRIQAVTVFALFASSAWSYALLGLREHAALLVITLTTLAVNCVLVVLLGSSDGARGAAIGTFVADLVGLGRPRGVAFDAPPSLAAVPWRIPEGRRRRWGRRRPRPHPGFSGVPLLVAASSVYLALVFLLRAVPEEVLVELKRLRGAPASSARSLRIGLNLAFLVRQAGGAGTYARELIPELLRAAPKARITAFASRELHDEERQAPGRGRSSRSGCP